MAREYTELPESANILKKVLLRIIGIVFLFLAVLTIYYLANGYQRETIITGLSLLPVLFMLELARRDRVQAAGVFFAGTLIIMVTMLATVGQGIHDIGIIAYPPILLISSLYLRKRIMTLLAILSILCAGWLVLGEKYQLYEPAALTAPAWVELAIVIGILIFTAVFVQLISDTVRTSLDKRSTNLQKRLDAEKSLREAETMYKTLVEQTSVIIYRDAADEDATALYISPQIVPMLGYSLNEWNENPNLWQSLLHPDDFSGVMDDVKKYITTGEKSITEYRLRTKDQRWIWVHDESIVVKDKNGTPEYIHGVIIDITEQKKAEQSLNQREAILGAVAETAQLLLNSKNWRDEINIVLELLGEATGASHVYIFENRPGNNGELLSSQRYEWVKPGNVSELDNPDYQDTRLASIPGIEAWYNNLSTGKPFYGSKSQYPDYWEKRFDDPGLKTILDVPIIVNGQWWGIIGFDDYENELPWSNVEADALIAAAGNIGTVIERQITDENLRASEEKFNLAFRHTYVAIALSKTSDHTLLDVNDSFCKITGYSREEVIGKRAGRDLHVWVNQEDRNTIVDRLGKQGYVDEYKAKFRRKNGQEATGLLYAVNVSIANEPCELYSFVDISNIERLLDELTEKNNELEAFTYTVSHDLKAPLVTISGFLGYLEHDARNGEYERLNKDILRISEAVSKMQMLLNELLELSRIGRITNPPEAVPFRDIVDEALSLTQGRLGKNQVQVEVEAELPIVYGDRARLVEVIQNLVDNAAKFMGEQPKPLIRIGRILDNDRIIFYVRDNGIGIQPEQTERVFGLFNKLDPYTEGTGIGLALIKRIVEVNGGKIWVESKGIGKGTTFYFTLGDQSNSKVQSEK